MILPFPQSPPEIRHQPTETYYFEAYLPDGQRATGYIELPVPTTQRDIDRARAQLRARLRREWQADNIIITIPDWSNR